MSRSKWVATVIFAAAAGCSSSGASTGGTPTTGAGSGGSAPGTGADTCTTFNNDAAEVTSVAGGATLSGTGGTIADGTYHATVRTDYGGTAGAHKLKVTVTVAGTTMRGEWAEDGSDTVFNANLNESPTGEFEMNLTCPQAHKLEWDSFAGAPTTFTIFSHDDKKSVTFTM